MPKDIAELYLQFGKYGTVAFKAPRGWNPTTMLEEMEYCVIYSGPESVTTHMTLLGKVTVFDDYGTESG